MDRFVFFRFFKALSLCVVTAAAGCSDGRDTSTRLLLESDRISVVDGQQFDELFIVVDSLVLEESETVVTVLPKVSLDLKGGLRVADAREHQVRVYSSRGELEQVFGAGTEQVDSIERPQRANGFVEWQHPRREPRWTPDVNSGPSGTWFSHTALEKTAYGHHRRLRKPFANGHMTSIRSEE